MKIKVIGFNIKENNNKIKLKVFSFKLKYLKWASLNCLKANTNTFNLILILKWTQQKQKI